jgi:hypothetical protein
VRCKVLQFIKKARRCQSFSFLGTLHYGTNLAFRSELGRCACPSRLPQRSPLPSGTCLRLSGQTKVHLKTRVHRAVVAGQYAVVGAVGCADNSIARHVQDAVGPGGDAALRGGVVHGGAHVVLVRGFEVERALCRRYSTGSMVTSLVQCSAANMKSTGRILPVNFWSTRPCSIFHLS